MSLERTEIIINSHKCLCILNIYNYSFLTTHIQVMYITQANDHIFSRPQNKCIACGEDHSLLLLRP